MKDTRQQMILKVLTQPDGHVVTVYDTGLACTCNDTASYTTDFGPLKRKYIPCQHMKAYLAKGEVKPDAVF